MTFTPAITDFLAVNTQHIVFSAEHVVYDGFFRGFSLTVSQNCTAWGLNNK